MSSSSSSLQSHYHGFAGHHLGGEKDKKQRQIWRPADPADSTVARSQIAFGHHHRDHHHHFFDFSFYLWLITITSSVSFFAFDSVFVFVIVKGDVGRWLGSSRGRKQWVLRLQLSPPLYFCLYLWLWLSVSVSLSLTVFVFLVVFFTGGRIFPWTQAVGFVTPIITTSTTKPAKKPKHMEMWEYADSRYYIYN